MRGPINRLNRIVIAVCLFIPTVVLAESFSGKVVKVSDGDTISVMHRSRAQRIRLHGIDTPEKGQAFGNNAKKFTSDLVFGRVVTVQVVDIDRYGRIVGEVILPDGRTLNRELVRAGLAWWYRKYSKDKSLGELEKEARTARRGLWIDTNPIPPWEFRKKKKAGSSKDTLSHGEGNKP